MIVQHPSKHDLHDDEELELSCSAVLMTPPARLIVIVYSRAGPLAGTGYHHLSVWPETAKRPSETSTSSESRSEPPEKERRGSEARSLGRRERSSDDFRKTVGVTDPETGDDGDGETSESTLSLA